MSTWKSRGRISPVRESSIRSSSWRTMRKLEGTMPLAAPECTPSVSTSTVSTPPTTPRSDVVPPELLVVAAAGVETHDEARRAELDRERVDVVRQARAPALLARLDEHDAARVARPLFLQRLDRGERGEGRVAVVADAAAVELVVAAHRSPRSGALGPADHLRLLVEMAVEQHGVGASAGRLHQQER